MNISNTTASKLIEQLSSPATKLGEIRKIAKEIKKDHPLAMELWGSKSYFPRQLAILIFDKKELTEDLIDQLDARETGVA